jgi:DNA-binding response OmpR family regulator
MNDAPTVLIIEDGDEYFDNLTRFVPGPHYLQAHGARAALELLASQRVSVVYLDMRFDRLPPEELVGDVERITREQGSAERALRHLANHQGLYILQALRENGHAELPVILAYDFSREAQRFERLSQQHPSLTWVPDAISPDEIRARLERLSQPRNSRP